MTDEQKCRCGRNLEEKGLGDVCAGCESIPNACGCDPVLDPAGALERLRKAAGSAGDDEDLVPVAVDAELRAMARQGMDVPVRLAVRSYLSRERKRVGVGVRDLARIEKEVAAEKAAEAMRVRAAIKSGAPHPSADAAHLHTPPSWASEQDILARMVETLRVCMGLVGEDRNAKLIYLAITSRLLDKQVSTVAKGLSSSGKSYTIQCVVVLFPEEAVYTMTAMSERALIYLDEPLSHRTIILYEATALREGREKADDNQTAYIVRSLLSEGQIEYPVVMRQEDGSLKTEKLIVPGPTNLVTSTTSVSLHPENETRMLSLASNDSKAQTRRVLISSSDDDEPSRDPDAGDWHAYQRWLASGNRKVTIPFAKCVAAQIPPDAVRLRRDWNTVRALIRAHALMHQLNRDTDEHGRIIAGFGDYEAVRSLVADLVAEGIGSTVPESVRQTVETVAELAAAHKDGVPVAAVAAALNLERTSATRRLHTARDRGYLVNDEDQRGKPARYVLGEPLPGDTVVLPEREDICTGQCTHLAEMETAGQDCDCEGVCRCAGSAEGIGGAEYEMAAPPPLPLPASVPSADAAHLHTPPEMGLCPDCGEPEDSIIHAVNCLGEGEG